MPQRVVLLLRMKALPLILLLMMQVNKLYHFLDYPCSFLLLLDLLGQVHLGLITGYHLLLLLFLVSYAAIGGGRRLGDVKTVPQVVPLFD